MKRGAPTIYHFAPGATPPDIAAAFLTTDETSRAAAFRFPGDAAHWSSCRAMLRRILGAWLGIQPLDVPLMLSPFGKPLLAAPFSSLHFNISHAPELAIIAINPHGPVGVDLEPLSRAASLLGCEATFCHPEEISGLPDEETARAGELLRIWTAKEAYLKALGTGFSIAPETIRVATRQDIIYASGPGHESPLVRLQHPSLQSYLAHFCVLQPAGPPEIIGVPEMPVKAATAR